ncbi:Uncharacterised protein [Mycolicibacterium fortuitum]|uniref:Uncharacterized protein n=1 Tax=Mycolicibacterium fortuitum TaxID=1766 RepID=A0A378WCR2_MYCFO|nr:Uncharacterised protein [Mycolicibacterium fortuitum]
MTNTIAAPMTHGEILLSARVLDGATRGLRIRWMQDIDDPAAIALVPSRGGSVMQGVLRRVVDHQDRYWTPAQAATFATSSCTCHPPSSTGFQSQLS